MEFQTVVLQICDRHLLNTVRLGWDTNNESIIILIIFSKRINGIPNCRFTNMWQTLIEYIFT